MKNDFFTALLSMDQKDEHHLKIGQSCMGGRAAHNQGLEYKMLVLTDEVECCLEVKLHLLKAYKFTKSFGLYFCLQ